MSLLSVQNITKNYKVRAAMGGKKSVVRAVCGLSFTLLPGQCLGIVGESGCGKSTMARMLCGLETPDSGSITFDGTPLARQRGVPAWRRDIQFVWQDSHDAVNPRMTAAQILQEPLQNFFGLRGAALRRRQEELVETVGLLPGELHKRPGEFSGGQLQRICIARALAAKPRLLILDEPLSSLDVSVQAQVLNLLRDIKDGVSATHAAGDAVSPAFILISHDIEAVYYLADSLAVMYGGQFVEMLSDITDYDELRHPYTKRLFASPLDDIIEEEGVQGTKPAQQQGCVYAPRCPKVQGACHTGSFELRQAGGAGHLLACPNC